MTDVTWRKSSFSFSNSNCIEVAELPGGKIGVRDSKNPGGAILAVPVATWQAFVATVKAAPKQELTWIRGLRLD